MAKTATSPTERAAAAGFTLLELLVVLAIIAAVAAIGIPRLVTPSSLSAPAEAARAVAAALRETRLYAVRHNRPAELLVDVERRSLGLPGGARRSLPASVHVALYTGEGLVLDSERGAIRFFPDGSSSGGEVGIRAAGGGENEAGEVKVSVNWLTGRVHVSR